MYYTYILFSKTKNKFYIGSTENLERRLNQHNSQYSKSTKSGVPWELVYNEEFESRSLAVKRESEIKRKKSRSYIENLIKRESVPNEVREGHRFEHV